jgi:hypothetical protein
MRLAQQGADAQATPVAPWWAQLVGAPRVHPHKHCADDPSKISEEFRKAQLMY